MMLIRALLAFIALPGIFTGLIPTLIVNYDPYRGSGYLFGLLFLLCGVVILLWCVRDFLVAGHGTLAPWDPPKQLVITGLYRYSRNPMYVGIINILAGWALYAGSPLLAGFCLIMACAFYLRVMYGEERVLANLFGEAWTEYARSVSRWLPYFNK